jgi:hypothetical protein
MVRLAEVSGMVVAGLAGFGKTMLVAHLLGQLAPSPAVQFVLIDGKGGPDYDRLVPRAWLSAKDDLDQVRDVIWPPASESAKQRPPDNVSVTAQDDTVPMSTGEERTGVLILRAWVEDDDEHPLRVRITRTARESVTEPITSASVTIEAICTVVQDWLEHLVDDRK